MIRARPAFPLRRGLRFMLAAAFFFAIMAVLVKALRRIPTQEVVLVRSLLNVAFTLALAVRARAPLLGRRPWALLFRGLLGYAALSFHFYALQRMPLADAVLIHNAAPVIVALLGPLVLGEPGGRGLTVLALVGLGGVAVLVRPTGEAGLLPALAALAGASFSAVAYLTIRALGRTEHPLTVVLYFPLVSAAISWAPALAGFVRPTGVEALALLGVGATTTVAQVCLTNALRLESASAAAPVAYTGLVFVAVFDYLLFSAVPDGRTLAGSLLIIGVVALIARRTAPPLEPEARP